MLLIGFGTRPEYLKLKPIINGLDFYNIKYKTLFIKQHTDIVPDCKYDYAIEIKKDGQRLHSILSSTMDIPDYIFETINYVLIQGDTTSVLALAMNAYFRNIRIIHVEAGVRTYNKKDPFPEEINRQLISRLTSIHFCPTNTDLENLENELCFGDKYVVGNTVIDSIKDVKTEYNNKVLITLHRRNNWNKIPSYFKTIDKLARWNEDIEFILPIHPNPIIEKYRHLLATVTVTKPLSHKDVINIIAKSLFVITDSGGITDEACFLNKKVIVIRDIIENQKLPVVNQNIFLCKTPEELMLLFDTIKTSYKVDNTLVFGNGSASIDIIDILRKSYLI